MRNLLRHQVSKSIRFTVGMICLITLIAAMPAEAKKPKPPKHDLCLDVIVPKGHDTALQNSSGWALTLHMRTDEGRLLGIGKASWPPTLPGQNDGGWLVFDDPDGCPSFINFGAQTGVSVSVYCNGTPSSDYPDCTPPEPTFDLCAPGADPNDLEPWPFDETWVEFVPGVTTPEWVPQDERETLPEVWMNYFGEWRLYPVGPYLGPEDDFTRYGRWARMPGLVILADHGPGFLTQTLDPYLPPYDLADPSQPTVSDFFDPPYPREAWNLAGLFNTVGYNLLSDITAPMGEGETSLTAQLITPAELFTPVVLVDREITIPFVDGLGVLCEAGGSAYRLDGGPVTCTDLHLNGVDPIINDTLVTLRVFVVNGDAPDLIIDMNGDGVLDLEDVEEMGYDAVTGEELVHFYQHHQLHCGYNYDFDGDGETGGCVLGARAGGITGVPR